jgi:hypothetical protein
MRRLKNFVVCFAALFLLSSCSTVFLDSTNTNILEVLGKQKTLDIQMQITRGDGSYTMDLVVDIRNKVLTVIGSSFGTRIFTLYFDGNQITEGPGSGFPKMLPKRLVIDDIILTLVILEAFETGLPKGCSIFTEGDWRKIYCNSQLIVKVKYKKMFDKNEQVIIERLHPKYLVSFVISEVK